MGAIAAAGRLCKGRVNFSNTLSAAEQERICMNEYTAKRAG